MAAPLEMSRSRTFPVAVADAFDRVLPMPLPQLFASWYGPIPPIASTLQTGEWGTAGQSRTVLLTGPGRMRETLTDVRRPSAFGYRLTDLSGPLAALVESVTGEWRFEPAGTGTRITWTWWVTPRGVAGRAAMPVFARLWRGYARNTLDRLDGLLV